MASSSGTATTTSSGGSGSGSYPVQNSGSEEELQRLMDQRKRKRMVSNRESARRSRMRKQKHLDELVTQLSRLRTENNRIAGDVSVTLQRFTIMEAENSVLKAQAAELGRRLESLNQMIEFMSQPPPVDGGSGGGGCGFFAEEMYGGGGELMDELMMSNSVSCLYGNQVPILASADMIQYY
ncbi:hypothetical protein OSB04_015793 [Centaurea solstitialis]|uniref:BZIP domain-containing protein n=1 Tax=Centaurea solstitialis TaxID=347529 RepID=A0AA38T7H5_9ASTR|nr:hypothetical protein OSB04_015793 [Centaurea solstitialis]